MSEGVHRPREEGSDAVFERRRYLGDTLSMRIHDADRERENCRLGEIGPGQRRWYDSFEEALGDILYRECSWCLGGSNEESADPGVRAKGTSTETETATGTASGRASGRATGRARD
jgi:hypothetical protein